MPSMISLLSALQSTDARTYTNRRPVSAMLQHRGFYFVRRFLSLVTLFQSVLPLSMPQRKSPIQLSVPDCCEHLNI